MNDAECERADSLEGWVAVRSNIFDETDAFKLGFIVQWNVIESKFAVTCHNRTLQRQKRRAEVVVVVGDRESEVSWAGLFSLSDLRHVHQQFACVADVLATCFPDLSEFEEGNIWDLLLPSRRSGPGEEEDRGDARDLDAPCRRLEKYFSAAIDVCGRKIVLDTLFGHDERDVEEYFENLQEFKRKTMQEEMARAKGHVRQLLQSHGGADRMVVLLRIYDEEDEAYQDLVTVATTFFHYLLQPFRDMRELASLYKMEILKTLEFEDLGPKRIASLEKEAEDWRTKAEEAVASIQDITVTYFAQTSKALAGMTKQMEEDRCRFGAAAWASAVPRLEKLRFLLAKETLQHMRAAEMCLNRKKDGIRERLSSLSDRVPSQRDDPRPACEDSQQQQDTVDQLELQFYETQLELYDTKFDTLKNEEQLLVAQIDTVRRQIKELKDEVVYYDVCEDPEELHSLVHTGFQQADPPAVSHLNRRLRTLEAKRGNICARRAYLRNKKDQCMDAQEQKQLAGKQSSKAFSQHHQVHLQREKKKEEEQSRKQWVDLEREKTLSRLRSFRQKRQGQYILKTPHSRTSPTEAPCPSQPLSIISLGPSSELTSLPVRPEPRLNKASRKRQPKDIPVQIYSAPLPPTTNIPTAPPPPPPPPPLLPPPLALPRPPAQVSSEDAPMALSEKEEPPFPAKNMLKQNIGTMDEVLASLQRGQTRLRKVPARRTTPPAADPRSSLMSAIRGGVALRKVIPARVEFSSSGDNELERSIKAAMMRMKNVAADSDSDDRGDEETQSTDWDS
ncbi:WASP homolog-associated protein with actin, membranes and microtubules isoform X1 [Scophthalmus maximus]|uniref:WASP homolog-associated protein with actin, membranes and microtubules isoform X1 n=1 Tax=Scophthalmus maximus TaxID=52904 RepID=UPI001FA866BF|nr:WASP homolog-associated protein with actin, membranes and microtubules isoform X1 [Scophthalmus maximus]